YEHFARRQNRPFDIALALFEAAFDFAPEHARGLLDTGIGEDDGAFGQIVEQRRGLREKQRQVIFDAGWRDALADILIDGAAAVIDVEMVVPAFAETLDGFRRQRKFA